MPSKRYKKALELVDAKKLHALNSAVEVLSRFPKAKFNETVELAFRLGVDPKQSDQMVRGTVPLPHGSGKTVKVLVFAKPGGAADAARAAGAEHVGYEDLIKQCNEGWADFDVAIATPEAMSEVRKLGKVLGPRGLMPNPKTGTVTDDTARAVKEVKAGRVEFKIDKAGNAADRGKRTRGDRRGHQSQTAQREGRLSAELHVVRHDESAGPPGRARVFGGGLAFN